MTGSAVERAEAARRAQEAEEERRAAYRASVAAGYKPSRQAGRTAEHDPAAGGEDVAAWRRSVRRTLMWICGGVWFVIISANIGALIWLAAGGL